MHSENDCHLATPDVYSSKTTLPNNSFLWECSSLQKACHGRMTKIHPLHCDCVFRDRAFRRSLMLNEVVRVGPALQSNYPPIKNKFCKKRVGP